MAGFRYVVDSCTCETQIEIISDGVTVTARCVDCKSPKAIGRTEEERREKMLDDDDSGVPAP